MKLGTENRTTTIVAIALFAIAAFMLVRMFSGGGQPAAAANPAPSLAQTPAAGSTPAQQPGRAHRVVRGGRTSAGVRTAGAAFNPLDPRLRLDLLKQSEDTEYKGTGKNIFIAQADIPQPIASAIKPAPKPVPQPPPVYTPPPPPPINLKFFGFAASQGEPKKVFLGNGDDVFVAGEGDIVNRRYKVMKINNNSVEIEDVLSNNRQTIPLTAG